MFEPVSNISVEGTINTFIKWFYQLHGLPLAITLDRGI